MKKKLATILSLTLMFTTCVIPSYASSSFTANAVPNPEGNFIALNWNSPDSSNPYSYIVYQQHEGEETYQSIPSTEEVKVLEIYPVESTLKGWVQEYGQGKMECDAIYMDDFNEDPSVIWNYDVIVFGFYDFNNHKDLTATSKVEVEKYIAAGKGVLFGHDTIGVDNPNFKEMASYVNLSVEKRLITVGDKIYITKKGLLTNYPYEIGEIGDELTIPPSHVASQVPSGDIWMNFTCNDEFYLTTWNNCAMIQTGHSKGAATPDEQRLLMNTIFYLAQITQDTSAELHMGQDLTGPTLPKLVNSDVKYDDETITLELASEDRGDTYNYYVEATNMKNDEKQESNKTTAIITTGLKGYSIVVDNSPNTIPDSVIETEDGEYVANFDRTKAVYVHVKAIDNVGNASEVLHYAISDTIAPTMPALERVDDTLVLVPGVDKESGVARHEYRLNDGEWQTWESDMDLKALEDGEYTLEVKTVDYAGNESEICTVDFKVTYKQVAEAIAAVEKVEETFDVEDYDRARELVDALDPSDIKEELTERLDMIAEMIEEDRLLKELQEIKAGVSDDSISEDEFNALVERFEIAKEQVDDVIDKTTKKRLQKLVDEIEAIIAAKKHHLTDKTFILTAVPQIDENNVALKWDTDINLLDYTYRIFAQKDNEAIQSIPAKGNVKVLEVYPTKSYLPTWVDKYDTVDKISCDAMSIERFNETPEIAWDYDVIVVGFADSYAHKDLVDASTTVLKQCIESGKGVLFSHDTLSVQDFRPYLNSLAIYANVAKGETKYQIATEAYIAQNGGIVNYPYYVGNLEEEILLPETHVNCQSAAGNVWVRLHKDEQAYLATWNNCGVIQTGHKPNVTNETEQKLLLNTIYYLAQITEETSWNDYMGQDLGRPTIPQMSNIKTGTKDGILNFELSSDDEGTMYTYYVEATCTDDNSRIQSSTASAIMVSGLKGYSIVIDEEEDTVPDNEIEIADNTYSVAVDFSKPFYVHIKAIDNVGNSSEVMHYHYTDTVPPTTPSMTVEDDILKLIPSEDYGYGIAQHVYSLNGSEWKTWDEDINLMNFEDGEYAIAVKAIDNAGNESEIFNYTVSITYYQDQVNALSDELASVQTIFEDDTITQEAFERALTKFQELKVEVDELEKIDSNLVQMISNIEEILSQRETRAEEEGSRAEYYVRLAERYQKESYIERAREYVEDLIASTYKGSLIKRLDDLKAEITMEEETTTVTNELEEITTPEINEAVTEETTTPEINEAVTEETTALEINEAVTEETTAPEINEVVTEETLPAINEVEE